MVEGAKEEQIEISLVDFIKTYTENSTYVLMEQINRALLTKKPSDLFTFYLDFPFVSQPIKNVIENSNDFGIFSKYFENAVKRIIMDLDYELFEKIQDLRIIVRIKNFLYDLHNNEFANMSYIRDIGSNDFDKYICVRGTVKYAVKPRGKIKSHIFRCTNCGEEICYDYDNVNPNFNITKCPNKECSKLENTLILVREHNISVDYQKLEIEELTQDSKDKNPTSISVYVEGDIARMFEIGDTIIITGNLRRDLSTDTAVTQFKRKMMDSKWYSMLQNFGANNNGMEFDYFLEANYVEKISDRNIMFDIISHEEREIIEALQKDPKLLEKAIESFAPKIYGHDIIKEAIIYLLIGGIGRSINPNLDTRGEIHILLFGDPSTAKTELLEWALKITYKSRYVDAGTLSKAGLTGGAIQTNGGEWQLTAGTAVACDMGLMGIDELLDADDETLSTLNEIMERQTVTIDKIKRGNYNTRVSLLCCTNPNTGGRYDPNKNIADNLKGLRSSIISRLDSKFLFRDYINESRDRQIVKKMRRANSGKYKTPISMEMLAKYIHYVKNTIRDVEIPENVAQMLEDFYIKMRQLNNSSTDIGILEDIPIVPRQYNTLERYTIASARFWGRRVADLMDAEAAIRTVTHEMETLGIDIETGRYDASVMMGAKQSVGQMTKSKQIRDVLKAMTEGMGKIDEDIFIKELQKQSLWKNETIIKIDKELSVMERNGEINRLEGDIYYVANVGNRENNRS